MKESYVAIDFETSGYERNSACAVGLTRVENGLVGESLYVLIRPPSSRVLFTHIHGLTWAMLRTQPSFAELWPRISAFFQGASAFIAHNATFDRSVLRGCCEAVGVQMPTLPFLCTLKGARRFLDLPSNRLDVVCSALGLSLQHHHAASDALAAAQIYVHLRSLGAENRDLLLGPVRGGSSGDCKKSV